MPFNYEKSPIYPHLDQIKKWSDEGIGSREIAKRLGFNRSSILRAYRKLGLDTQSKLPPIKPIPKEKECKSCHLIKEIKDFAIYKAKKDGSIKYLNSCIECEAINQTKLRNLRYNRYKLRYLMSSAINRTLYNKNLTKNGQSCIKFLPYTIEELKNHIESKFESWMNWNNWGKYNKKEWDENNPDTWKWNLDHIIPASKFTYSSVYDEGFQKCWSLNNLRPLSAKINIYEGDRR